MASLQKQIWLQVTRDTEDSSVDSTDHTLAGVAQLAYLNGLCVRARHTCKTSCKDLKVVYLQLEPQLHFG